MAVSLKYIFNPSIAADAKPSITGGGTQTVKDVTNSDGTITRTIRFASEPTGICFGNNGLVSKSFIKVIDYPLNSGMTDLANLFNGCSNLIAVNLTTWDVSNVINMNNMFYSCESLIKLDMSSWDVQSLSQANNMFSFCKKLKSLNLFKWRSKNASLYLNEFLYGCEELEELNISYWRITEGFSLTNVFYNNKKLKHIGMVGCSENVINRIISILPTDNVDGAKIYASTGINVNLLNNTPSNWTVVKGDLVMSKAFMTKQVKARIRNCRVKEIHVGVTKTFYHD